MLSSRGLQLHMNGPPLLQEGLEEEEEENEEEEEEEEEEGQGEEKEEEGEKELPSLLSSSSRFPTPVAPTTSLLQP